MFSYIVLLPGVWGLEHCFPCARDDSQRFRDSCSVQAAQVPRAAPRGGSTVASEKSAGLARARGKWVAQGRSGSEWRSPAHTPERIPLRDIHMPHPTHSLGFAPRHGSRSPRSTSQLMAMALAGVSPTQGAKKDQAAALRKALSRGRQIIVTPGPSLLCETAGCAQTQFRSHVISHRC